MALPLFIVDAFTAKPFAGNPAAICFPDRAYDDCWHQALAGEMNLSETAFIVPRENGFGLRWFTPAAEVDLCGHATLASAHVLWETGRLNVDEPAVFSTRSGKLTCRRARERIEMDFPAERASEAPPPPELLEGLGARPQWVGRNRMDYVALLDSESTLRNLCPDLAMLIKVPTRGIIVTAKSSGEYDFVSRAFFPRLGVPEDPVCGSAHCALGPFWRERLGKTELTALQVSKRGGVVHVRCAGERVVLGGQAVTIVRGELVA
jgi:PhzF family phenazine biosynthesis protein